MSGDQKIKMGRIWQAGLPQKWQAPFITLLRAGKADQAFLDFADRDTSCKEALENCLLAQSQASNNWQKELRHARRRCDEPAVPEPSAELKKIATAFRRMARGPFLNFVQNGRKADEAFLGFR